MNALVTGGGGFLGLYIVERLVGRDDRVRSLARGSHPQLDTLGVESIRGDVGDARAAADACKGMDVVFHVAGVAGIWGPWDHYYQINTVGTRNIVAGCRAHGVGRLVYTSSPSVTFDGTDQAGVDESAPYPRRWLCHYAHTKALAEQHVLSADGDGLLTCALRPHLVWGPRDAHLVPRLLDRARRGKLWRVGDGTNLIDTVYVENAAAAHLQAADALAAGLPVRGRAYFISQGEPVNCWEWIDAILDLAGLPPVNRAISKNAAWRLGAALETVYGLLRLKSEPRMTRFLAAQLTATHYFDIGRARTDFGYNPQISNEQAMIRLHRELAAGSLPRRSG